MASGKIEKSFTFNIGSTKARRQAEALAALVLEAIHSFDNQTAGSVSNSSASRSSRYSHLRFKNKALKLENLALEDLLRIEINDQRLTVRVIPERLTLGDILAPNKSSKIFGPLLREILNHHEASLPLTLFNDLLGSWCRTDRFSKMLLHALANEAKGVPCWLVSINLNEQRQQRVKSATKNESLRTLLRNPFQAFGRGSSHAFVLEEDQGRPHLHGFVATTLTGEELEARAAEIVGMRLYAPKARRWARNAKPCYSGVGAVLYCAKHLATDLTLSGNVATLSHQAAREAKAHQDILRGCLERVIGKALSFRGRPPKAQCHGIVAKMFLRAPTSTEAATAPAVATTHLVPVGVHRTSSARIRRGRALPRRRQTLSGAHGRPPASLVEVSAPVRAKSPQNHFYGQSSDIIDSDYGPYQKKDLTDRRLQPRNRPRKHL